MKSRRIDRVDSGQLCIMAKRKRTGRELVQKCLRLSVLMSVICLPAVVEAADSEVQIEQPPRAFGHLLGDVLVQQIRLPDDIDFTSVAAQLPQERTGPWLERQSVTVNTNKKKQQWLRVRYQIINAPTRLITAELPPVAVTFENGETLQVSAWPISIGALTPEKVSGEGDLLPLRPDRALSSLDTTVMQRKLSHAGIALGVTVLSWLLWWLWRQSRDARRLPFAKAFDQTRKHGTKNISEHPDAWMAVHQALNQTAGQSLHSGSVSALMEDQPWLQPFSSRIEQFYAASAARFFEQPARTQSFPLFELIRDLYRAEKRNAG